MLACSRLSDSGDDAEVRGTVTVIRATLRFGLPISQTLVIWVSPSHITLAIWVRVKVRVTGDAHIKGFWERGYPYAYHRDSTRKYMPFLSPVSSHFVVVLLLFQFREPDFLG